MAGCHDLDHIAIAQRVAGTMRRSLSRDARVPSRNGCVGESMGGVARQTTTRLWAEGVDYGYSRLSAST